MTWIPAIAYSFLSDIPATSEIPQAVREKLQELRSIPNVSQYILNDAGKIETTIGRIVKSGEKIDTGYVIKRLDSLIEKDKNDSTKVRLALEELRSIHGASEETLRESGWIEKNPDKASAIKQWNTLIEKARKEDKRLVKINITSPECPPEMVLIKTGGVIHPDEPAYCIGKTEVTQAADNAFWAKQHVTKAQPKGVLAGPDKPAIYRAWNDAMEFCKGMYEGGDLPTKKQWQKACGSGKYCTQSGGLSHAEAVYYDPNSEYCLPMDVGSTVANLNGLYDMTGNVREWLRDADESGLKYFTGGAWFDGPAFNCPLCADLFHSYTPRSRAAELGFRCVAPPLKTVEGLPKDSKK